MHLHNFVVTDVVAIGNEYELKNYELLTRLLNCV